ncbi:MAG TPA: PD-(D/E)XK nuclease family protein, partial [Actinoplanes sp.]|nr:PD-(D/E)XK nuclease family protein [Actinoplanes sp.]
MTVTTDSQPVPADALPPPNGPSLSPSRAADFKTCPLLFRLRTIDRLPERPSADQVRGTLVHAVLERLFDLPAAERTPDAAAGLVAPEWARLVEQEPGLAELFAEVPNAGLEPLGPEPLGPEPLGPEPLGPEPLGPEPLGLERLESEPLGLEPFGLEPLGLEPLDPEPLGSEPPGSVTPGFGARPPAIEQPMFDGMPSDETARLAAFLRGAGRLLDGYFAVEDPRRLEPAERESLVSTLVDDDLLIRGYIDRLDISPAGDLRVVDYKTGGAPREAFEGRALFQLKFYALVLWRTRAVVPRVLRLLYLKDAEICDYSPDAEELERFERTLIALSQAIERAKRDRDFRPKPSRLCDWCSFHAFCPEFGGTPPPYPEPLTNAEAVEPLPPPALSPVRAAAVPPPQAAPPPQAPPPQAPPPQAPPPQAPPPQAPPPQAPPPQAPPPQAPPPQA